MIQERSKHQSLLQPCDEKTTAKAGTHLSIPVGGQEEGSGEALIPVDHPVQR